MDDTHASDLLAYIDASPSPFHAVDESRRRLEQAGFRKVEERDAWSVSPGDRFYTSRGGSSLVAVVVGEKPVAETGFRLLGAHTDSPTLRLKPAPAVAQHGYAQLGVEVYGGALYHTWLDRELSFAGRVWVAGPNGPEAHHVDLGRQAVCRIPSLAIHLNRTVNTEGLLLNAQEHLKPILGLGTGGWDTLCERMLRTLPGDPKAALSWELSAYDVQPATRGGLNHEFLFAARLDNLAGCHGALSALLDSGKPGAATRGIALYDHEECGSQSARGAKSNLLEATLRRVAQSQGEKGEETWSRALSRSFLVSSDMAHGIHPNYPDRHEPAHRPVLGHGPVIKSHVNQAYATDAEGFALFEHLARENDVPVQRFVSRNDLGCGSTIGPITAARLGLTTLDVGNPMLSMHSSREMAAAADVEPMIRLLRAFLQSAA